MTGLSDDERRSFVPPNKTTEHSMKGCADLITAAGLDSSRQLSGAAEGLARGAIQKVTAEVLEIV